MTQILLGDTRSRALVAQLSRWGWGRMFAESRPSPAPGEPWGFDNGAFGAWQRGEAFDARRFSARLAWGVGNCRPPLVAVVPDRVAEGRTSLAFSQAWLKRLPDHWPWYLAVQDGMSRAEVEAALPAFAGLFLGGADRYKATAGLWCELAHRAGKRFHYARAGTAYKLAHALEIGADSLDSSFPLWERGRLGRFREWVRVGFPDRPLPWETAGVGRCEAGGCVPAPTPVECGEDERRG